MAKKEPSYFLVKSEPNTYSFRTLVKDGRTRWDGVRNFTARNNLREMQKGDLVLFYHSTEGKEIVGVARVLRTAYPDDSAKEGDWSAVDLEAVSELTTPISLEAIKKHPLLSSMQLAKLSRLSVSRVTPEEFKEIMKLSATRR